MNHKFIFLFLLFVPLFVNAQITTNIERIAAPKSTSVRSVSPYDSTSNLPSNKTRDTYIGQLIYIQPTSEPDIDFSFFRVQSGNISKAALAGRYYIVEKIEEGSYIKPYTLTLRDRDNPEIVLEYHIDFDLENISPKWVTVSYYNYLKSQIGTKYYCLMKKIISPRGAIVPKYDFCLSPYDIYTGNKIEISRTQQWELIDLKIHDESKRIIAIFKNEKGETSFADLMDLGVNYFDSYFMLPKSVYDRLTKKYGSYYTKMVLNEHIEKGMPKELFKLMKGSPYEIHPSSYQEQWVYSESGGRRYYYFSSGKLTGWN